MRGRLVGLRLWGKRNVGGKIQEVENLNVEYDYVVHGNSYAGTTVAFYTLVYPETVDFANNHPKNSEVTIYYQTSDPAKSVLIPGPKPGKKRYSDIILASIGLIVAVCIAIAGALGILG